MALGMPGWTHPHDPTSPNGRDSCAVSWTDQHVSTRQHDTAGDGRDVVIEPNGHVWQTESRHWTGDGAVSYQRCRCGRWRVLGPNQVLAEARSTPASTPGARLGGKPMRTSGDV
jgi:hypothetical protein